jgi:hypothetical protein
MKNKQGKVRAFAVECLAWEPPSVAVIRTTSAARAKFRVWNGCRDVGYRVGFGDFRVKRAKQFDGLTQLMEGRCYGLDYAESLLLAPSILDPKSSIPF